MLNLITFLKMKMNKTKKKPGFHMFFTVEVSNLPTLFIVANSFGECAWKAQQHINSLETKEAHDIINIRRNVSDALF